MHSVGPLETLLSSHSVMRTRGASWGDRTPTNTDTIENGNVLQCYYDFLTVISCSWRVMRLMTNFKLIVSVSVAKFGSFIVIALTLCQTVNTFWVTLSKIQIFIYGYY